MLQRGGRLDLGEKPLAAQRRGEIGVEHLDRDAAIVLHVVREVHGRHAAATELALDAVAIGERLTELRRRGHEGVWRIARRREGAV